MTKASPLSLPLNNQKTFSFDLLLLFHVQSLSGHTSGIDSVNFDSSEALVAAGAASGTIKLWDLEEAKSMLSVFHQICGLYFGVILSS